MKKFQVKYFVHAESLEDVRKSFMTCVGIVPEIKEVQKAPPTNGKKPESVN